MIIFIINTRKMWSLQSQILLPKSIFPFFNSSRRTTFRMAFGHSLSRLVDLCHSATRSSSSAPDELLSPQSLNRMAKGYSLIVYYSTGESSSAISSPFTVLLAEEEDALCCRQFRKAGSSWTAEPSLALPLPLEMEMMKTNILFFLFAVVARKTIPAAAPWRRCPLNDDMYTYLNWTADKQAKESLPMDTRCNFPDP